MKRLVVFSVFLILASTLTAPHPLEGKTRVLTGDHIIVYDIVNPLGVEYLPNYSNNSYKQEILTEDEFSKRVKVEVNVNPLNSSARFPIRSDEIPPSMQRFLSDEPKIQTKDRGISAKARELVRGTRYVHEAFAAIADWIIDNMTYDAGPTVQQDAKSVITTRRGSCVGFTCLCIAMLRSVGIPARYAHGYLPPGYDWGISKEYWGVKIKGGGFHAWVETYYPDIGWTFSDLEHSKNFADPFHILRYIDGVEHTPRYYKGGELDVENATTYTIFREENTTLPIDQLQSPKKTILGRQRRPQELGTVYGSVTDKRGKIIPTGEVVLWKGSRGRVFPFEHGKFSVIGLPVGNLRVTFRAAGYQTLNKTWDIKEKEVINTNVKLTGE